MNNTVVREIRGAKINPKSSFKNYGAQNTWGGGNYASKYGISLDLAGNQEFLLLILYRWHTSASISY
jgi:hypothetical protein